MSGKPNQDRARTFLVALVVTLAICGLASAAFVAWVNPWENYGELGMRPLFNARRAKVEVVKAAPSTYEAYVLGSSNVMRFRDASIQEHLGLRAFNFGVFWGRSEDFDAISSYLLDELGERPKLFIVGLDSWTLRPPLPGEHPVFRGWRRRLLNTPELATTLPEFSKAKLYWSRTVDALSWQQLEMSWQQWRSGKPRRRPKSLVESGMFVADGTRVGYGDVYGKDARKNIFAVAEEGKYPITRYLEGRRIGRLVSDGGFANAASYEFEEFWEPRLSHLRRFLQRAKAHGVRVVIVFNPIHPTFRAALERETRYTEHLAALRALLAEHESNGLIEAIVDASDVAKIGADPDDFFDEIHPTTRNCDRVLELIAREVGR